MGFTSIFYTDNSSLSLFLSLFSVCETVYPQTRVVEPPPSPQCKTITETKCTDSGNSCYEVPREVCRTKRELPSNHRSAKMARGPTTNCRVEIVTVCGPEKCPLVQREPVCFDELKTVGLVYSTVHSGFLASLGYKKTPIRGLNSS